MKLYFLSSNLKKLSEYRKFLKTELHHLDVSIDEIQGTMEEIIEHKVKTASKYLSSDSDALLVDDVGFEMDGLHGLPGPYCKDFIKIGIDNIFNIGQKVGNRATAIIYLAFYYKGSIKLFSAVNEGTIVSKRMGLNSEYCLDSIFYFKGKTFSEMTMEEKYLYGYRGLVCQKLLNYFKEEKIEFEN